MKEALNNIFRPPVSVTGFFTVRQRISSTRYEVEDLSGRLQVVEVAPDAFWPPGVQVVVQNGRIVGSGHRVGKHRVYEV